MIENIFYLINSIRRYVEDQNTDLNSIKHNKLVKVIGNISSNSEITFQYGIMCTGNLQKRKEKYQHL
jgi:hypothetical protein